MFGIERVIWIILDHQDVVIASLVLSICDNILPHLARKQPFFILRKIISQSWTSTSTTHHDASSLISIASPSKLASDPHLLHDSACLSPPVKPVNWLCRYLTCPPHRCEPRLVDTADYSRQTNERGPRAESLPPSRAEDFSHDRQDWQDYKGLAEWGMSRGQGPEQIHWGKQLHYYGRIC